MKKIYLGLLLLFVSFWVSGQNKKLGIVGSSTAKGVGASVPANSWVNRVTAYYTAQSILSGTTNLAESGYDPYYSMPTGYVPPANRPSPDVNKNISKLLTFNPDVVIIAFANNNYQTYSFLEIHATLDSIYTRAVQAGKVAFVATSQPRTGFTLPARQKLRDVKDSIIKWFGNYTINFFDPIVNPVDLTIRTEYRYSGDEIHLNDAGHEVLFNQVIAKGIFDVVLSSGIQQLNLKKINTSNVEISWTSATESANTVYTIERKSALYDFQPIHSIKANGSRTYRYSDMNPIGTEIQYRIWIQDGARTYYSTIVSLTNNNNGTHVQLRGNPALSSLNLLIDTEKGTATTIRIMDFQGRTIITQPLNLSEGTNNISIGIDQLNRGQYISTIVLDGKVYKNVFQKQ